MELKTNESTAVVLAKFWIPVHGVNVKEHGSAGVGHICAVDSTRLAARQTLFGIHQKRTHKVIFLKQNQSAPQLTNNISMAPVPLLTYPNDPGVDSAEHGAVRHDGFMDLVHVVHQPAKFHCAEVSADGEPCFMLQDDNDMSTSAATSNVIGSLHLFSNYKVLKINIK